MPLEHLQFIPVLQADNIHQIPNSSPARPLRFSSAISATVIADERAINLMDEAGQDVDRHAVAPDMGRDDFGRQIELLRGVVLLLILLFQTTPPGL